RETQPRYGGVVILESHLVVFDELIGVDRGYGNGYVLNAFGPFLGGDDNFLDTLTLGPSPRSGRRVYGKSSRRRSLRRLSQSKVLGSFLPNLLRGVRTVG